MKMEKYLLLFFTFTSLLFQSCYKANPTIPVGSWVKSQPFKGLPRTGAVTFTASGQVFAGLGYNGKTYLSDFFVFDGEIWKSVASFPGVLREGAVSFAINNIGYVGLGSYKNPDGSITYLNDFWEYDATANQWKQLNNFGGSKRAGAVAVAIDQSGFVGTGYDGTNYYNDFWEYMPSNDSWQQITGYPSTGRAGASAFVINGKMLLVGGKNNGLYFSELWEFDPQNSYRNAWTDRAQDQSSNNYSDFKDAVRRSNATAFAFMDKAYIVLGTNPSLTLSTYEYDPTNSNWKQKSSFEGSYRQNAICFVSNGRAYVGLGDAGSSHYDDLWEWRPNE